MKQNYTIFFAIALLLLAFSNGAWAQEEIPEPNLDLPSEADSMLHSDNQSIESIIDSLPDYINQITDTLAIAVDSTAMAADSLQAANQKPPRKPVIDIPINYDSADSISFSLGEDGQMAHLYGNAKIIYGDIELTAGYININFQRKEIYAEGITDSTGNTEQKPHFKQGTEEFDCSALRYNFETSKGFVHNVVTKQQDGVVHSEKAKMVSRDVFCMTDGKYSTCDADHPHFYLHITKGKVLGQRAIISGRAYLVLLDFPIYVPFLPYGYLPTGNKTYSSGIIIPSYGEEASRGFFLRDGGFYWAASDYFDFTIKGDLYSKGGWALKTSTNYRLRYKFSGNFSLNTSQNLSGIAGINQTKSKDFSINWSHNQDPKSNPNRTIGASVNFATSGYNRMNEFDNFDKMMSNQTRSNITYRRTFANTPFTLTMNMSANQSTSDSTVVLDLPTLKLNMRTIQPFKRKNRAGKKGWMEETSLSYSTDFKNTVKAKEYDLLTTPFSEWQKGIKHNIGISLPSFKILKHINITPSFSYGATWHFNYIERYWLDGYQTFDENNQSKWVKGRVEEKTVNDFNHTYAYNYGFSGVTTVYGMYQMKNPNSKIKAVRHKITPSFGFNINPDLRDRFHDWVQTDSLGTITEYSKFSKTAYPYSASQRSGSISFGLKNNIEMKVVDLKDTTSANATKKIPILEDFSFNGSYNLVADSMKLSNISWSIRSKIGNFPLSLSGGLSPYAVDARGRPYNKYRWSEEKGLKRLGRITHVNIGIPSLNLSSDKMERKREERLKKRAEERGEEYDPKANDESEFTGYQDFKMPWTFNLNYSLSYSHDGLKPKLNQNLSFGGNVDISSVWKANFNSSFDFKARKLNGMQMGVTRSLHCWNMSFSFSPLGTNPFYMFTLSANANMLKDLKVDKSSYNR